jgi:hypothetical protein
MATPAKSLNAMANQQSTYTATSRARRANALTFKTDLSPGADQQCRHSSQTHVKSRPACVKGTRRQRCDSPAFT